MYLKTNKSGLGLLFTPLMIGVIISIDLLGTRVQALGVPAGEQVVLATFYEVDRHTCRPLARPNLWLTSPPTVGRAHIAGSEAVVMAPQCDPQKVPIAQVIYEAPTTAGGKVDRLSYGASFQQLDRNHTRTMDLVIQP
jgi:hypothetical protein